MPTKDKWHQTHITRNEIYALMCHANEERDRAIRMGNKAKAKRHQERWDELNKLLKRNL